MKFSLYKILTKIPAKQDERLNFRKYKKLDFDKNLILVSLWWHEPLKRQPHKMVRHTQTIRRLLATNPLKWSDTLKQFVGFWWRIV